MKVEVLELANKIDQSIQSLEEYKNESITLSYTYKRLINTLAELNKLHEVLDCIETLYKETE